MAFIIQGQDVAAVPDTQSPWYETDIAILVAGISGVGVLSGCEVTAQGTPDMTVAVASGSIQPSAGAAAVAVTGDDVAIDVADSDPRIDLVTVDASGALTYTAGTPAPIVSGVSGPKPPALPDGHVALAMIDVPGSASEIDAAQITDKRVIVFAATAVTEITDLPTSEMDDSLVLAPTGDGGVEWRAEAGGGGSGMTNPMSAPGDLIIEGSLGADLALSGTATADINDPSNTIDGNDATYWSGNDQGGHWVRVDLGAPLEVAAWRALFYDSLQPYYIESSDDDTTFTVRATVGSPGWDTGAVSLSGGPVTAQYWRIRSYGGSGGWWRIKTLSFFAPASPLALPVGTAPALLGVVDMLPAWILPTIRNAAGVPSGAPTGTELPIAVDTTSSPGTWYLWNGSAWVS